MDKNNLLQTVVECKGIPNTAEGVFYDGENGRTSLDGQSLVSMNMWGFHPHLFELLAQEFNRFVAAHTADLMILDPGQNFCLQRRR